MTRYVFGDPIPPPIPQPTDKPGKNAPRRRITASLGLVRSGPLRGQRYRFELECGHTADRIPYEHNVILAHYFDPAKPPRYLRCALCAEGHAREDAS